MKIVYTPKGKKVIDDKKPLDKKPAVLSDNKKNEDKAVK